MNSAKPLRILSVAFVVAAALAAGYGVYAAERTEPVVVAKQTIPSFTLIQPQNLPNDFTIENVPVKAIEPGALDSLNGIAGHTTQMEILANAQVQVPMLNSDNSLQALVNSNTSAGNVTFSVPYKPGSMDEFVAPDSFVNLAAQGQNGTTIHADRVLVLQNTGYSPDAETANSQNQNQQNQTPLLVMTLPESTYLSMFQSISTGNVQVLLIPQNQAFVAPVGSFASSQPSAQSTGGTQPTQLSPTTAAQSKSSQTGQHVANPSSKASATGRQDHGATKGGTTH